MARCRNKVCLLFIMLLGSWATFQPVPAQEVATRIEALNVRAEDPRVSDGDRLLAAERAVDACGSAAVEGATKFNTFVILAEQLIRNAREDESFKILTQAVRYYREDVDPNKKIMFNAFVGQLLVGRGDEVEGIRHLRVAESLAESDPVLGLKIQNMLSSNFRSMGIISESLIASRKAIRLAKSIGAPDKLHFAQNNLAWSLTQMNHLGDAEKIYHEMEKLGPLDLNFGDVQLGLAEIALQREQLDVAKEHAERVLIQVKKQGLGGALSGRAKHMLAKIYLAESSFSTAEDFVDQAIDEIDPEHQQIIDFRLTRSMILARQPDRIDESREIIESILTQTEDKSLYRRALKGLAEAMLTAGQFEEAATKFHEIILRLESQRYEDANVQIQLAELEEQSAFKIGQLEAVAALEKQNAQLAKDRASSFAIEARLNRIIRNLTIGVATFLLIGFFLFYNKVHEHRKTKLMLQEAEHTAEMQKQQDHHQRLEAIGHLTGSVAHDFNNLLQVFSHSNSILKQSLGDTIQDTQQEALDAAEKTIETGASITDQLLTFARQQAIDPKPTLLADLFAANELLMETAAGDDVNVVLRIHNPKLAINVDRSRFASAILNLLLNARDAMDGRGSIEISASEMVETSNNAEGPPKAWVKIDISDHGKGMHKQECSRAFEPYFTTKPDGAGNGLGLSSVKGFVEQSRGSISLESEVGIGTNVSMLFPSCLLSQSAPEPDVAEASLPEDSRILIVDDNIDVLNTLGMMLESIDFDVCGCANAEAALQILERQPFSVLISDIRMPGKMDGMELARICSKRFPQTAIILVSGNEAPNHAEDFQFIRKPYTLKQLQTAVQNITLPNKAAKV